jgi:hypothetical protein
LQALEDRHGPEDIPPSRADLIDEFHETFKEIDQDAYRRLRHFRDCGIAHLTPEKMLKSTTLGRASRVDRDHQPPYHDVAAAVSGAERVSLGHTR